jgi:hypothetical protein
MQGLKDYPQGDWLETGNQCLEYRAYYEVLMEHMDQRGILREVQVRVAHLPGCTASSLAEAEERAGWDFTGCRVNLGGQEFAILKCAVLVPPCVGCQRFVVYVYESALVFVRDGYPSFCESCVQQ